MHEAGSVWPNAAQPAVEGGKRGLLVPLIDRLRQRFVIGRVCIVADRGMISAETIAALEARGLLYILG